MQIQPKYIYIYIYLYSYLIVCQPFKDQCSAPPTKSKSLHLGGEDQHIRVETEITVALENVCVFANMCVDNVCVAHAVSHVKCTLKRARNICG